ncbi:MAG TPA: cobaltochelatase subunit CobN [Blastocatellia bacterium]|nr:cobaltochelatase subunit CobN [Blastocatellia bacterium]
MKISVFYVGTSLLAPLRRAESEINKTYALGLTVAPHNCGAPLNADEWKEAADDVAESEIVFIIHVTDSENAARILELVDSSRDRLKATIAFNCMPDLMRRTRMGRLDFAKMMKSSAGSNESAGEGREVAGHSIARKLGSWMADFVKGRGQTDNGAISKGKSDSTNMGQYVKLIGRLPVILKFVPGAGKLGDVKNYLLLFCYFLQPTSNNIRSMLLYAIKSYAPQRAKSFKIEAPETMPVVATYHPDAPKLFEDFEGYKKWYERKGKRRLDPKTTVGLLLMRPQIVSDSRRHYDCLIRAIEAEGLSVLPVLSTLMDNRESCRQFFVAGSAAVPAATRNKPRRGSAAIPAATRNNPRPGSAAVPAASNHKLSPTVSQVVSLTGFSFVGGPAMNDSEAAVAFLSELNVPLRSLISLDVQTIENWSGSRLGLNPIQTAMQVAIPEIDGATEPFVFGGLPQRGDQPEALEDRCRRIARRLARWNRLQVAPREDVKLAFLIFCFPPDKGNIGTAADLDVFPSLWEILAKLKGEGYKVKVPASADHLRKMLLEGDSLESGALANSAYRMSVDEYRLLCPYIDDIERDWGPAPGTINSNGREILIPGIELGNVFVGVQPTFGYEGDPMRMLASESGAPHHGFMGLYTYIERVFGADAVVHVGTHGSMEFMPGKQVGLSASCWPDRLIGELPNLYLYSVNNPAEGAIAKRRSYAELVSYLTPPIENAGLYKGLASLKELLSAYRQATGESERAHIFAAIEDKAQAVNL